MQGRDEFKRPQMLFLFELFLLAGCSSIASNVYLTQTTHASIFIGLSLISVFVILKVRKQTLDINILGFEIQIQIKNAVVQSFNSTFFALLVYD